MNTEEIQKFIQSHKLAENKHLKITFKKRNPVYGIIVHSKDSAELEAKNFWRVVTLTYLKEFQTSKDMSFSRIFNGSEFIKIAVEN